MELRKDNDLKDKDITIPVGTSLLGRVLNASGEPIDQKGAITEAQRVPFYSPTAETKKAPGQLFETGIKVIDLLAPIPRRGMVGIFAEPGLGKQVVMEELVRNVATGSSGYMVGLGMDASTYEASELMEPVREGELESKTVMLFEQMTDEPEVLEQLVLAGLTIARHFVELGHQVLLVADRNVALKGKLASRQELRGSGVTTVLLWTEGDYLQFEQGGRLGDFDSRIVFGRELPKQKLWPAIDRLRSGSRLLDSNMLSAEQVQVVRQVRQLLQKYGENSDSHEEQRIGKLAKRIQFFLTQPFFVAEPYTDIPGEYVKVEDTIRGCKELLEGRYDDVPEQAFWFVGTIKQALAKGKMK